MSIPLTIPDSYKYNTNVTYNKVAEKLPKLQEKEKHGTKNGKQEIQVHLITSNVYQISNITKGVEHPEMSKHIKHVKWYKPL